jgi:C4-dicarboxylate-specific signal transduction histidine kinase
MSGTGQVILNLVMNGIEAMKDTPDENRIISIRTSRVENFAELSVSDRGSGIPEDKLSGSMRGSVGRSSIALTGRASTQL